MIKILGTVEEIEELKDEMENVECCPPLTDGTNCLKYKNCQECREKEIEWIIKKAK